MRRIAVAERVSPFPPHSLTHLPSSSEPVKILIFLNLLTFLADSLTKKNKLDKAQNIKTNIHMSGNFDVLWPSSLSATHLITV